jgi:hypothetical protein
MDENTGWSLLCALAILLSGALAGWALAMPAQIQIARAVVLGCSTLPLLGWLVVWALSSNSTDHWRRTMSIVIGAIVGPTLAYCTTEIVSKVRSPRKDGASEHVSAEPAEAPPIGSLRLDSPTLQLDYKISTKEYAARVKLEIHNDTKKLIKFHAITAGRINEIPFDHNKIEFDGYIDAGKFAYLLSRRIPNIPIKEKTDIGEPKITAFFEYQLSYKYADSKDYVRTSAKGVRFEFWSPVPVTGEPNKTTTIPTVVSFYNENEE